MRYLIILCLFAFGCKESTNKQNNNGSNSETKLNETLVHKKVISETENIVQQSSKLKQLLERPLDVLELKRKYHATSTFVQYEEAKRYYKPSKDGFFGIYIFRADELVVFNNEMPWKYDNQTDVFIEIRAETDFIVVLDSVKVGMNFNDLKEYLGEPQEIKNDMVYYHNGINAIASFRISGDTIDEFRVGKYNVNIKEEGIPEFLKDI